MVGPQLQGRAPYLSPVCLLQAHRKQGLVSSAASGNSIERLEHIEGNDF